jgi:hypothetical protein
LAILSNPKDPQKVLKLKELAHRAKDTDIHGSKSFSEEKFLTVAEALKCSTTTRAAISCSSSSSSS